MADRPGRNDPCHCGSGLKYKKCHLEADEQAASAARAAVAPDQDPAPGAAPTMRAPMEDPTLKTAILVFGASVVLGVIIGVISTPSAGFTVVGAGGLAALLYAGLRNPPRPHDNPGDPAGLNFGMQGGGDEGAQDRNANRTPRRPQGPRPPRRR